MMQGFSAGGMEAFTKAVFDAEEREVLAEEIWSSSGLNERETGSGIEASGRTPDVICGWRYANGVGASTASCSVNVNAEISKYA